MKSHVLLVGQSTPKHKVFIFDAYGKLFKIINVSRLVLGSYDIDLSILIS